MKKIDTNLLLKMIKEGKSQKECAEFFKVSCPAICKRLKRLSPPPSLDKYGFSEKQKAFVIEKAKGASNTEAALKVYDCKDRASAKALGVITLTVSRWERGVREIPSFLHLALSYLELKGGGETKAEGKRKGTKKSV